MSTNATSNDAMAGYLLIAATVAAFIFSNSSLQPYYHHFLDVRLLIQLGTHELNKPLLLWVNDGLMTIFFFMIGLELKYERMRGHLQHMQQVILPCIAALGGVLVPIMFYSFFNYGNSVNFLGWAIPMATDIAFVFGFLALFGNRLSPVLKIFLLTLAIIDDLAAIVVIALFHVQDLSILSLSIATIALLVLLFMNVRWVCSITAYVVVGLILWVGVLKSGVHATLSGVLLAFFIPLESKSGQPICREIENYLRPIVILFIMPLFAFANAGLEFSNLEFSSILHPITMGIIIGLVLGKPLGVLSFVYLYKYLFSIQIPLNFKSLLIVGILAGIGFTMSLFIAGLSFGHDESLLNLSRLGIFSATVIAMLMSAIMLLRLPRQ